MEPTIGRIVWIKHNGDGPHGVIHPAIVCAVADAETVEVQSFGPHGGEYLILTRSEGLEAESGWDWMPYQKSKGQEAEQAARTAADKPPKKTK